MKQNLIAQNLITRFGILLPRVVLMSMKDIFPFSIVSQFSLHLYLTIKRKGRIKQSVSNI